MIAELAKLDFADVGTPTPAVKHDALVSLGKHLGMFTDRHVIEHWIAMMTPEERLEQARQLIEMGRQYLPLLDTQRAEEARGAAEAAKTIEHEADASMGETAIR